MTANPTSTRSTAAERREHLLKVAMVEFASRGFVGGSTERIAKAAGISQPYVFRLFGSKLQLFLAVLERCMADTLTMFEQAVDGRTGEAALEAIGHAYTDAITSDPTMLQCQLVGYAACDEPAVREAMRLGYGRLVKFVERVSGTDADRITTFFAKGMLLNVITAMQLQSDPSDWGNLLIEGCLHQPRP